MIMDGRRHLEKMDFHAAAWMARHSVLLTRLSLGIIFFWFGVLKYFPGASEAETLAGRTILKLTFGHVPPAVSLPILATWECTIGLCFLSGRFVRVTLALLFLQLPGTFMPLVFFPSETWRHAPFVPTLLGQYILKNMALVCAGLLVGATMRGGVVIADPRAAQSARWIERVFIRFRRRFGREANLVPLAESIKQSRLATPSPGAALGEANSPDV